MQDAGLNNNWQMKKYLFIILVILTSCNDALFDAGDIITKEFKLDEFNEIYINDVFDVCLIQDTVYKITVEGGANLIPNITFNLNERILNIDDNNTARWSRKYERIQINLHFINFERITLQEPSLVYSTDTITFNNILIHALADFSDLDLIIKANKLHFANSSSSGGLYKIKGETEKFTAWVRGSGQLQADNFKSKSIYLRNSTMGDCYIHAEDELTVTFENTGLIYYKGNPQIEIETPEYYNQLIKINY